MAEAKYVQAKVPLFKNQTLIRIFGPSLKSLLFRCSLILAGLTALTALLTGLLRPASFANRGGEDASHAPIGWMVGDRAPNFVLQSPEGHSLSLHEYRGRPIMLNFWYISCPNCVTEAPALRNFYADRQQEGSDFVILGVNVLDSAADTHTFVRQQHLNYPVALDQEQQVMKQYHINATPSSIFIDRHGVIRAVVPAPLDEPALQRYLDQIDGW